MFVVRVDANHTACVSVPLGYGLWDRCGMLVV